jgi:hypothetical protein
MPMEPETAEHMLTRALRTIELEVARLLGANEQGRAADLQIAAGLINHAFAVQARESSGRVLDLVTRAAAAPPQRFEEPYRRRDAARRALGADSSVTPLRDFERVAYGFIATDRESIQRDTTWHFAVQAPFRATGIVVWAADRSDGGCPSETMIESLLFHYVEQLDGGRGVPAGAFRAPLTPAQFLSCYLEEPPNPPQPLQHLIGERIKATPLDTTPSWIQFPAIPTAAQIEVRFRGALVGLAIVGHQLRQL